MIVLFPIFAAVVFWASPTGHEQIDEWREQHKQRRERGQFERRYSQSPQSERERAEHDAYTSTVYWQQRYQERKDEAQS